MFRNNPASILFSKAWKYSGGSKKNIYIFWTLFIVGNAVDLAWPLILANMLYIINREGVTNENMRLLAAYASLMILIGFIFWACHGPARVLERLNAFNVRARYKKHLLKGTLDLPMEWHADHHSGDTIDKVEKGTTALFHFSEESFEIIQALVQLIGSYIILAYFNLHASYIILIFVALTIWVIAGFDRALVKQYRTLNRMENKISESVFDVISNISTVIILRVERQVFRRLSGKIDEPYALFRDNAKLNEIKWAIVSFVSRMMLVTVIIVYLFTNIGADKAIIGANLVLLWNYLENIRGMFFRFAHIYGDVLMRRAKVMNSEELSDDFLRKPEKADFSLNGWKKIKIENLNFSYHNDDGAELHLENISLDIGRGERIALVGESGSGKSTLFKIMMDLYQPNNLALHLDGIYEPGGFKLISRDISLIPQDPEIFSTTIIENIDPGLSESLETVKKYSDMACFTEVAENLPKKFDSSINEKGVNLSGGEKQRLALARGLLASRNRSVVLLDESTSNVDLLNEMHIYRNIFGEFPEKTLIASVHRLHLLPLFNKIYFFSDGKIVSSGALAEILNNCEKFRAAWAQYKNQA